MKLLQVILTSGPLTWYNGTLPSEIAAHIGMKQKACWHEVSNIQNTNRPLLARFTAKCQQTKAKNFSHSKP